MGENPEVHEIQEELMRGTSIPMQEAPMGLSWVPYKLFSRIVDNCNDIIHVDLSKYDIDGRFSLKLSPQDEGLSHQLRIFGFREPLNCRCYVKFVEESDTLLDIGANIGFFTLLGCSAKRIVCVEPLDDAIALLRENLRLNNLSGKCEVVHAAVGPKGRLLLEVNPHLNLSKVVESESSSTISVRSIPLDTLVTKYSPNLIRLDVEGFEYEILHDEIPDSINKISMEFHSELLGEEKSMALLDYFKEEGFRVRYFVEDLPLRLYPFLRVFKSTGILRPWCNIWANLDIDDVVGRIFSGRALKYLYLER